MRKPDQNYQQHTVIEENQQNQSSIMNDSTTSRTEENAFAKSNPTIELPPAPGEQLKSQPEPHLKNKYPEEEPAAATAAPQSPETTIPTAQADVIHLEYQKLIPDGQKVRIWFSYDGQALGLCVDKAKSIDELDITEGTFITELEDGLVLTFVGFNEEQTYRFPPVKIKPADPNIPEAWLKTTKTTLYSKRSPFLFNRS